MVRVNPLRGSSVPGARPRRPRRQPSTPVEGIPPSARQGRPLSPSISEDNRTLMVEAGAQRRRRLRPGSLARAAISLRRRPASWSPPTRRQLRRHPKWSVEGGKAGRRRSGRPPFGDRSRSGGDQARESVWSSLANRHRRAVRVVSKQVCTKDRSEAADIWIAGRCRGPDHLAWASWAPRLQRRGWTFPRRPADGIRAHDLPGSYTEAEAEISQKIEERQHVEG